MYVSPFEVEAALVEHPAVLEAAVIGVDDRDGLTRPKAFVVLKQASDASDHLADDLKEFVKERLAPYKYPRLDRVPARSCRKPPPGSCGGSRCASARLD